MNRERYHDFIETAVVEIGGTYERRKTKPEEEDEHQSLGPEMCAKIRLPSFGVPDDTEWPRKYAAINIWFSHAGDSGIRSVFTDIKYVGEFGSRHHDTPEIHMHAVWPAFHGDEEQAGDESWMAIGALRTIKGCEFVHLISTMNGMVLEEKTEDAKA